MVLKDEKSKKGAKKVLDAVLTVGVTLVLGITVIVSFLTFINVQKLSRNMDIVKNNVWIEKTNSYDSGSSSFFDHKVEAVKKDNKDGDYIKGELINRSGQRITEATVYFKLYDKDGNLVDWSADSIKTWDSGEKWVYNAPFPEGSTKYEFAEFDIAY